MFYTTLLTYDNVRVVIPNSTVTSGTVVNYSSEEKRRVDIDFTAAYSTDVEKAKRAILEAAYSTGKILPEPCAEVVMTEPRRKRSETFASRVVRNLGLLDGQI